MKLGKKAVLIVSGAIMAVGVSMFISNPVMTTGFIMGISVTMLGVAIILLARRKSLKPTT
jgi:hypothetical protein